MFNFLPYNFIFILFFINLKVIFQTIFIKIYFIFFCYFFIMIITLRKSTSWLLAFLMTRFVDRRELYIFFLIMKNKVVWAFWWYIWGCKKTTLNLRIGNLIVKWFRLFFLSFIYLSEAFINNSLSTSKPCTFRVKSSDSIFFLIGISPIVN